LSEGSSSLFLCTKEEEEEEEEEEELRSPKEARVNRVHVCKTSLATL
jgi:hypothetical protein